MTNDSDSTHDELIRRCAQGDGAAARMIAAEAFAGYRPGAERFWHQIDDRPDLGPGIRTGTLGAMTHLLDAQGRSRSDGFHEIRRGPDGRLYGKIGAVERLLMSTPNPQSQARRSAESDTELRRVLEAVKWSLEKDGWRVALEPFSANMVAMPSDFKATQNAPPLRIQVRLSAEAL